MSEEMDKCFKHIGGNTMLARPPARTTNAVLAGVSYTPACIIASSMIFLRQVMRCAGTSANPLPRPLYTAGSITRRAGISNPLYDVR